MPQPVQVYTWARDPSVSFAGGPLHQSVVVDLRGNTSNLEAYADEIHAEVMTRVNQGNKAVLLPLFEFRGGNVRDPFRRHSDDEDPDNWWNHLDLYDDVEVPQAKLDHWETFANRFKANETPLDRIMHDFEDGVGFWWMPIAVRRTYFDPLTIDDVNNPYPEKFGEPSPYIGVEDMGSTSTSNPAADLIDRHIRENVQYSGEQRAAALRSITAQLFGDNIDPTVTDLPYSNYDDVIFDWIPPNRSNRNLRGADRGQNRLSFTASPQLYISNFFNDLAEPEPEYVTERQQINRRRWIIFGRTLSIARSAAVEDPGHLVPWIAPAGYGINSTNTWPFGALAVRFPFELILWRNHMEHLLAMGISEFIYWNPVANNPFSEETDRYAIAFFKDRTAGPLVRDLPEPDVRAHSQTTMGFTTNESDLFSMTTVYYTRASEVLDVPYLQGWPWQQDNPLVISDGVEGDNELAAMVAAIESNQGTTVETMEIPPMTLTAKTAENRDQVSLRLMDRCYPDLTDCQQKIVDGGLDRALTQLQRFAHFFNGDAPTSAPQDWLHWLIDLATLEGSLSARPDLTQQFRQKALESQQTAITTYTRDTFSQSATTGQLPFTLGAMRLAIVDRAVRRASPIFPNPSTVDSVIDWTIKRIWKDAEWKFTQRMTVINIAADGTVTYEDEDGSPVPAIGKLIGTSIFYDDGGGSATSVDRGVLLRQRSIQDAKPGRPVYFHLLRASNQVNWNFVPEPDKAYTARALTQLAVPDLTNTASFNDAMAAMPPEFINIVRDMAYAKLLIDMGQSDGREAMAAAGMDLGGLVDVWESPGGQPERSRTGVWTRRGLGPAAGYLGGGV